jgi:hypothetical protein
VEADFSIINWEYNDFRTSMTEFSLEELLQCKQFEKLRNIALSSLRYSGLFGHIRTNDWLLK